MIWNVLKLGWCVGRDDKCLTAGLVYKTRKQRKRENVTAIHGSVLVDIFRLYFIDHKGREGNRNEDTIFTARYDGIGSTGSI